MSEIFTVRSAAAPPAAPAASGLRASQAEVSADKAKQAETPGNAAEARKPPSRQEVQKAVENANQSLKKIGQEQLSFSIDDETGINVVKLTDKQTGEVIQQIPSKTILAIAKSIDAVKGVLLTQQA